MPKVVDVEIRGAPWTLLKSLEQYDGPPKTLEYVLHGPRGTGKTLGVGWNVRYFFDRYPGIRILFVRRTRRSITQSFCPDFESIIIRHDPEIRKGAAAASRQEYKQPKTGSLLALAGLDDPLKAYGPNWDIVIAEEAAQFKRKDLDEFYGLLRQWTPGMKFQLLLMMTNPRHKKHDLLRRTLDGRAVGLRSYHEDNPKWYDRIKREWTPQGSAFRAGLQKMPGVLYRRNFLGEWCSAEGVVWEWDEEAREVSTRPDAAKVWRAAAMDWGYTEPCSFGVGEKDETGKVTLCREIYRKKMSIDWWTQEVIAARRDLGIKILWVDPSRPEIIEHFNRKMAQEFGASDTPFARPALNKRHASATDGDLAGLDLVRHYIDTGKFVAWDGRMRHYPDPELEDAELPCSFTDEVHEYVFWRPKESIDDENASRDHTDPACADHACDMVRYLIGGMDQYDLGDHKPKPIYNLEPEHIAILKAMGQWPPKEKAA